MSKWNAIFKAGRHTDSAGVTRDFSIADLDAMVAAYDPATHEAPLVIGHPKTDAPAYGWVQALKRDGDRLLAKFRQVPREVAEMVRAGRFKKVSVALYPDKGLRHVGLLGAVPPAVKGLGSVQLADGDDWQTYEFNDSKPEGEDMNELEELRAKLAEAEAKAEAEKKAKEQAFAEKAEAEKKAKAEAEARKKKEAEFAEARAAQAAKDREIRFGELLKAGKALPSEKDQILALAGALAQSPELTFSEGGKTTKQPAEDALWKFLEGRRAHELLGEFAQEPGDGGQHAEAGGNGNYAATF